MRKAGPGNTWEHKRLKVLKLLLPETQKNLLQFIRLTIYQADMDTKDHQRASLSASHLELSKALYFEDTVTPTLQTGAYWEKY